MTRHSKSSRETTAEEAADVQEGGGARAKPEEIAAALFEAVGASLTTAPTLRPREESVFVRQGDYWTIQYQGQVARLKATRGLHCLSCLLRHPGREFHVCELIAAFLEVPVTASVASSVSKREVGKMRMVRFEDAGPLLDIRAKAEYARRLAELRGELEEGQRFNDRERVSRARARWICWQSSWPWRSASAEETAGQALKQNARGRRSPNALRTRFTRSRKPFPFSVATWVPE